MSAALLDLQWELDGLVFGPRTDFNVRRFEWGPPEIRSQDAPVPRGDDEVFGRDYRTGRTLALEMNVLGTNSAVLDRLGVLESTWRADHARFTPGAVSVLRWQRNGRTRRAYGRPRKLATDSTLDWAGNVVVTAEFRALHSEYYSDAELTTSVSIVPPQIGGLEGELVGPIVASADSEATTRLVIAGERPAWLRWQVNGPITDPSIEVVGQWSAKLTTSLAADQWLLVDPSPWNRGVRRNDGVNLAGKFTADSQPVSGMRLPPGEHEILLRGTDPTRTATMTLFAREVFASW